MSERAPRVLLLDSGVDAGHPGVRGLRLVGAFALAADGSLVAEDPARDPIGHGTAVAAVLRETAPDVEVVSLRVFDELGSASLEQFARALRAAASIPADAVNCSLGFATRAFGDPAETAVLEAAARLAAAAPLVVPAALASGQANALAGAPGVHAVADDPNAAPNASPCRGPRAHTWLASPLPPRGVPGLPAARVRGASLACARVAAWLARPESPRD